MTDVAAPANRLETPTEPVRLRPTMALARSSGRDLRYGCVSLAAHQALMVVEVAVAAYVVSRAVRGATYDQLSPWILVLVLAALPQVRLPWAGSAALTAVANRVRVDQADRLFRAVDDLPPADVAARRTGELTAVAADDLSRLVDFFGRDLGSAVCAATTMGVAVVGAAAMDWRLGGVLAILLAGLLALAARAGSAGWSNSGAVGDQSARQARAEIIDDLQGLREIVVAGAGDRTAADLRARTVDPNGRGEGREDRRGRRRRRRAPPRRGAGRGRRAGERPPPVAHAGGAGGGAGPAVGAGVCPGGDHVAPGPTGARRQPRASEPSRTPTAPSISRRTRPAHPPPRPPPTSSSTRSTCGTATRGRTRSKTSASGWPTVRRWHWWAIPAPASPARCAWSWACWLPTPAPSASADATCPRWPRPRAASWWATSPRTPTCSTPRSDGTSSWVDRMPPTRSCRLRPARPWPGSSSRRCPAASTP